MSGGKRDRPLRNGLRYLGKRLWWTVLGIASVAIFDLAVFIWWNLSPETVPVFLKTILFGTIVFAPILALGLLVENLLTPNSEGDLPARDASDIAEAALTQKLREEVKRPRDKPDT
ncbi:hypothetical protein [Maricaulis sp.]|uniref:hypothetical protein n=1 Tax=Maricaulis sp. TaxID=1486257 RepID=UPI003A8F674E